MDKVMLTPRQIETLKRLIGDADKAEDMARLGILASLDDDENATVDSVVAKELGLFDAQRKKDLLGKLLSGALDRQSNPV